MNSISGKKKKSNPRRKRFGKTVRGKHHYRENLNLRSMPYYKALILPDFDEPLGFDVEFVSDRKTGLLLPAWVGLSVANNHSRGHRRDNCIFQAKIYHNDKTVDRMEKYSGVDRHMIATGLPLDKVKESLKFFFENYKIIGASMDKDLQAFGLEKYRDKCVDIQRDEGFFLGRNNQPIGLKTLTSVFLKKRIQSFNEGQTVGHSPITDSRTTVKLYKMRINKQIESESDSDTGERSFQYCRKRLSEGLREIDQFEKDEQRKRKKRKRNIKRKKIVETVKESQTPR